MKTIVKILLLVSILTLSGCMVVPARQQGYNSYLEGSGSSYGSSVYIAPHPVYITPRYGYSPYRGGYNRSFNYRRGWSSGRGWGGHHHHHHH